MTIAQQAWMYTGSSATFVVPPNVTSVRFECWGAMGSSAGSTSYTGGVGVFADYDNNWDYWNAGGTGGGHYMQGSGYVAGTLAVTPGDTYYIYVGGNGGVALDNDETGTQTGGKGGYNGGGKGGNGYRSTSITASQASTGGAGGGGATDIRYGGTALSNRILVAGGSGGTGGVGQDFDITANSTLTANPTSPQPPYSDASQDKPPGGYLPEPIASPTDGTYATWYLSSGRTYGGWGGAATGGAGAGGWGSSHTVVSAVGGKGGSSTAGGAAGTFSGTYGASGAAGTSGTGGAGASVPSSTASTNGCTVGGGGGGGGYYGGGGGATGYSSTTEGYGGGGGGGSNYVSGAFTATVTEPHVFPPSYPQNGDEYLNGGIYEFNEIGGFCRITYTQPPNAPGIASPTDYSNIIASNAFTVSWSFSSPDPHATYGGADIEYKLDGGSTWTLIHVASLTEAYTFNANTFTAGNLYDLQVRVYDQNGDVSPWTEVHFTAVTPPPAPTITAPAANATITSDTVTISWTQGSGSKEVTYEVALINAETGSLLYDSGALTAGSRMNMCLNPSFEYGTSAWQYGLINVSSVDSSTGFTLSQSTTYAKIGTHALKVAKVANPAADYVYTKITTVPGEQYFASVWVATDTYTLEAQAPSLVSVNPDGTAFTWIALGTAWTANGQWQQLVGSFTATQTTTYVGLYDTGASSATNLYIDMVLVELNNSNAAMTYFDGDNLNGNTGTVSWQGSAGNSASLLTGTDILSWTTSWSAKGWKSQPIKAYVAYSTFTSGGIPSPAKEVDFTVNLNPPGAPTVTLTPDSSIGEVALAITCPTTPNATATLDIYRTDLTNGTPELRIATNVVPDPTSHAVTYHDRTVATRVSYKYRVRAYSAGGGYADAT